MLIPSRPDSAVFMGAPTLAEEDIRFGNWRVIADVGDLDEGREVETGALIISGIGMLKAGTAYDPDAVTKSGIEGNCGEFYAQSIENIELEVHEGSSSRRKFSDRIRCHTSIAGARRGLLADCMHRKGVDVRDTTKHEFEPTAAQHSALIATTGEAGEWLCGFSDDHCELETTVPLEDEDAGSDEALDG